MYAIRSYYGDEQLCDYGSQIYILRKEFIENTNKKCSQIHSHISGGRENLSLVFLSNIKGRTVSEAYEVFLSLLKKNQAVVV